MVSEFRVNFFDKRMTLLQDIIDHNREGQKRERDFWSITRKDVRLSFGETDLELKVPFIFGGESEEIIEEAIYELTYLIKGRIEPPMVYDSQGGLMVSILGDKIELLPKGYRLGGVFRRRLEHEAAVLTMFSDPFMDAGLIGSWLSAELSGSRLIGELYRIYRKSIEEEIKLDGSEKTAYLTHLAVSKILGEKKEIIKKVKIKGINYERLERSISILFYAIVNGIISDILNNFRDKQLSYDIREIEYLLMGTTTPFFILNIKNSILNSDLNPYNMAFRIVSKLDEVYSEKERKTGGILGLLSKMTSRVMRDRTLSEAVIEFYYISKLRDDILDYLLFYDNQKENINLLLSSIIREDKLLRKLWEDSNIARKLESGLLDIIDRHARDKDRVFKAKSILGNFKTGGNIFRTRFLSMGKKGAEYKVSEVLKRYLVYRMDLEYDSFFFASRQAFENRKRVIPTNGLVGEYEKGRLYRFSADHKLSLIEKEEKKEGHLFCDLKGFTKKTKKAGSLVIAEFLKDEFFIPILNAAKRYYLNVGKEPDLGLELNNIPGDAITFSGNIVALVELAKEIRLISSRYKKKIIEKNPDFDEDKARNTLQSIYQKELLNLKKEKKRIVGEISELKKSVESKKGSSPEAVINYQIEQLDESIKSHIDALGEISLKIKRAKDEKERKALIDEEDELRGRLSLIKSSKDVLDREKKKKQLKVISYDFYKEVCRDEVSQISRLEGMLSAIYQREKALTRSYYERLGEIADMGVNTGLYISFGGVMETIKLKDDVWGNISVNIADKINEASRCSSRNINLRKRADRFVERCRFEGGNRNLTYPFNVIVGTNYSIIQPIDEEPYRFQGAAESFLDQTERLFMGDDRNGLESSHIEERFGGDQDLNTPELVQKTSEIYNLGEALSGDALREYVRESRSRLYFFEKRVLKEELKEKFWDIFAYDGTEIYLIFGVEHTGKKLSVEMFRYAGQLDYSGTTKREMTHIYEMIRPESAFYKFIIDQHFDRWYKDFRKNVDAEKRIVRG